MEVRVSLLFGVIILSACRYADFTKRNGSGGESIYGGAFEDEDLSRPLDSEGYDYLILIAVGTLNSRDSLLCMANKGPNTNGSQFFVTLRACPHLNGTTIHRVTLFGHSHLYRQACRIWQSPSWISGSRPKNRRSTRGRKGPANYACDYR